MEGIRDNAMAQALLGAIRTGPLTDSQLLARFNCNVAAMDVELARLRQTRMIDFTTEPTIGRLKRRPERTWRVYDKSNEKTQVEALGKHRGFGCLKYPFFSIGGKVKFEDGFLVTDDPQIVQLIEKSGEFELTIQDITDVLRGIPLSKQKAKIYLSLHASVDIEYHPRLETIEFEAVADGLFVLVSEDPEIDELIEHHQLYRAGQIRAVPRTLMETA